MYELKTNTAVRIAVGPLVDPTDGKTAETALTVTGLSVEIFQIKNDGSAVVRAAFSPTASGGDNDMVHVTDDTAGMYDLELTAAQLNWLGNGRIAFYDVDGFLVHWIDIHVVSANYFNWKYGTGNVNADVIAISGDTTAADNCELMFDGTGYAGGTTKLDVNTATIANGAITAAAIATGAIDADAIADNAIDAGAIADGAITAAKIADAAIDAATFAADVDAEIAAMVWNALTNAYGGAGSYGALVEGISAGAIADAVWDEIIADHAGVGSTGAALAAAGGSGDPWSTALPGSYESGTAGYLIGNGLTKAQVAALLVALG